MTRRDTIMMAILVNGGLLAILFLLAVRPAPLNERQQEEVVAVVPFQEIIKEVVYNDPKPQKLEVKENRLETEQDAKDLIEKNLIQIVVKRGDYLDKIARTNGTTVEEIKRINHLASAKISVGQQLLVPLSGSVVEEKNEHFKEVTEAGPLAEYYTLESGDNPWKVAKKFHVRFDHLLSLNDLNEERARHLKPGDVLRVR